MTMIDYLEKLRERPLVSNLLGPFGAFYGAASQLRALSFDSAIAASVQANVPVVSIGNITVGGTGKTPMVIEIAQRLIGRNIKVAILSRGYGRQSKARAVTVCQGEGAIVGVEDSGDEPLMIARAVPQAFILVGSRRAELAATAVEKYGAQIILLDDGFQHLQLRRDLDIVLFDFNDSIEKLTVLPQGRLREPLSALKRASAIVITKIPGDGDQLDDGVKLRLDSLKKQLALAAPQAVLYYARFAPACLRPALGPDEQSQLSLSTIAGKKVFAICGIARPQGFYAYLENLGAQIVDRISFGDHHWFSPAELTDIEKRYKSSQANFLIATEKDLVRLPLPNDLLAWTYALTLGTQWLDGEGASITTPTLVSNILRLTEAAD